MINICKCEFEGCPNAQNCKRFKEATGEIMNFKANCNSENNYEWICKIDSSIEISIISEEFALPIETIET